MDKQSKAREELKHYIHINKIKYTDFGNEIDLSKSMISMFINGHRNLSYTKLEQLQKLLGA